MRTINETRFQFPASVMGGRGMCRYCGEKVNNVAYHEAHAYASTWTAATADQKNRALVMATRLLDQHLEWNGWVVDSIQALQWPRAGCVTRARYPIADTVIPADVKYATAELARQLLAGDRTADDDVETRGITSLSAGSVSLAFDSARVKVKVVPDAVAAMVDYLGRVKSARPTMATLVRA